MIPLGSNAAAVISKPSCSPRRFDSTSSIASSCTDVGRPSSTERIALLACGVLERRVVAVENEPGRPHRSVAVFRDDDLGETALIRLGVVQLVAIDEQDDVGVLLDAVVDDDVAGDE